MRSLALLTVTALAVCLSPGVRAEPVAKPSEAIFALGCFWSAEHAFEEVPGVLDVVSGFSGGQKANPSYDEVSTGSTGHAEAVKVTYDPAKVSYEKLLDVYWHNVDATAVDAAFCDHGPQYRSILFIGTPEERGLAEKTRAEVSAKLGAKVATQIVARQPFYAAEGYHQDFARRHPLQYGLYREGCGRDPRLAELRAKLDAR